jgi:xanthine dehydrogenase accessory factor
VPDTVGDVSVETGRVAEQGGTGAADGPTVALVRGVNDVGSAVAHALFEAGYGVVIHDDPAPTTSRRGMAFADALFDGETTLAGVRACRLDDPGRVATVVAAREAIPVLTGSFDALLAACRPDILVDARMRKRATPERQIRQAALTVGLGPSFVAGETVDLAVETGWGDDLGRVYEHGATRALAGEPREIDGVARDRYVYAPVAGTFRTERAIGDLVAAGETVAWIEPSASEAGGTATPLAAPIAGALRGLTHDGVPVGVRAKVIEVDPRGERGNLRGIGERPGRIAAGILATLQRRLAPTATPSS